MYPNLPMPVQKAEQVIHGQAISSLSANFSALQPEELLKTDHIVINNNNTSCENAGNAYVFNQLSDKLIEQYEKRLAEKDSFIAYLQKELEELKR